MAVKKLTLIQRQWIEKSLETQANVLRRSLQKELINSDIWNLRSKEIEALMELRKNFASFVEISDASS